MRDQRYVTALRRRMKLEIKNMKWLVFIPFAVIIVMSILTYQKAIQATPDNMEIIQMSLIRLWEMGLPLFSLWWFFFTSQEYTEGEGKELFWACHTPNKTWDLLIYSLIYSVCTIPVFVTASLYVPHLFFNFLMVLLQGLFLCALYCFLQFRFNSTMFGIVAVLLLHIMGNLTMGMLPMELSAKINLYTGGYPILFDFAALLGRFYIFLILLASLLALCFQTVKKPLLD